MFPLIGSLISGVSSLFGSSMNASAQAQANYDNSVAGRVAQAKAAGINPLAALGAALPASQPVSVGAGVEAAGQDVGRAVAAQSSADERMFQEAQRAQSLEKGDLENQYLASQIRKLNQPANPPPMPKADARYVIDGQGSTVVVKPDAVTASLDRDNRVTPGVHPEVSLSGMPGGGYYPYPSKDFQGASFGSDVAPFYWDVRNIWGPTVGLNRANLPPPGEGMEWGFDPVRGYHQYKPWRRPEADKWYNFFSSPAY